MQIKRVLFGAVSSLLLGAALGCSHNNYVVAAPPPPPVEVPPLVQLAEHNGFEMGRADGVHALWAGGPNDPRAMRNYNVTPGYDPRLGPFPVYRDAFRDAYLRGFERGYHRG